MQSLSLNDQPGAHGSLLPTSLITHSLEKAPPSSSVVRPNVEREGISAGSLALWAGLSRRTKAVTWKKWTAAGLRSDEQERVRAALGSDGEFALR